MALLSLLVELSEKKDNNIAIQDVTTKNDIMNNIYLKNGKLILPNS